jgi:hypothetical protein
MNEIQTIQDKIFEIRGQRVMLDCDLAELYQVTTGNLNKAVKRNIRRFPPDFMFQLTKDEFVSLKNNLIFQNGISKTGRGGRRFMPFAFTEQGVAMLSTVLNSERAIAVNIQIMRTFVQIKKFALENKELSRRLTDLEQLFMQHCKDNQLDNQELMQAINLLMDRTKPRKIGFDIKS